jgi:hypothetical protein
LRSIVKLHDADWRVSKHLQLDDVDDVDVDEDDDDEDDDESKRA